MMILLPVGLSDKHISTNNLPKYKLHRVSIVLDDIGSVMVADGPGEIFYMHCDVTKEDEVKVSKTVKSYWLNILKLIIEVTISMVSVHAN